MWIWTSTIVDERIGRNWAFHRSQLVAVGQQAMTDEEYLAACQKDAPGLELRIRTLDHEKRQRFNRDEAKALLAEGLTQTEVARQLGVTQSTISNVLWRERHAKRNPTS
jgi:Helix-turn-helix